MIRLCLLCLMLTLGGCVSQQTQPEYAPRLVTAQNSDGVVFLSWKSEPGYAYLIQTRNPDSPVWRPLEGSERFIGNGRTINVQDRRDPRKPIPFYSLKTEKL